MTDVANSSRPQQNAEPDERKPIFLPSDIAHRTVLPSRVVRRVLAGQLDGIDPHHVARIRLCADELEIAYVDDGTEMSIDAIAQARMDSLFRENINLARALARQRQKSSGDAAKYDELFPAALEGLADAALKFNPELGRFREYATTRIVGAMKDFMRSRDLISRSVRKQIRTMQEAEIVLEKRLMRVPTIFDVARHMGVEPAFLERLRATHHGGRVLNLDSVVGDPDSNNASWESVISKPGELTTEEIVIGVEGTVDLTAWRELFSGEERLLYVFDRHFVDDVPLAKIGRELEVSESRVSQIVSKIGDVIASRMQHNGVAGRVKYGSEGFADAKVVGRDIMLDSNQVRYVYRREYRHLSVPLATWVLDIAEQLGGASAELEKLRQDWTKHGRPSSTSFGRSGFFRAALRTEKDAPISTVAQICRVTPAQVVAVVRRRYEFVDGREARRVLDYLRTLGPDVTTIDELDHSWNENRPPDQDHLIAPKRRRSTISPDAMLILARRANVSNEELIAVVENRTDEITWSTAIKVLEALRPYSDSDTDALERSWTSIVRPTTDDFSVIKRDLSAEAVDHVMRVCLGFSTISSPQFIDGPRLDLSYFHLAPNDLAQ